MMKFHYIAIVHALFYAHQKHVSFFFIHFSPLFLAPSIYAVFMHFPQFPSVPHAQTPLQNNVLPCSCVIPWMHIKSMLVLFFIHLSLLFHVHLSLFYPFPSFPYFKEGPYQDRPLLYPFHQNPSLLGSCSSPGSAFPQKIEKNSFTKTLAIPKHNPSPIHTEGFPFSTPGVSRCTRRPGVGHVEEIAPKRKP